MQVAPTTPDSRTTKQLDRMEYAIDGAPTYEPETQLYTLLRAAADELERTLRLVTDPPRPSFQGQSPLQVASSMLGTAARHLGSALAASVELPASPQREALRGHIDAAMGASIEAEELLRELVRRGPGAMPDAAGAVTTLVEQALAHARMSRAVHVGEP